MPRKFTEEERDTINEALIAAAERRFSTHGLAKTTVEELTRDVGISKGAFYRFYESKEDLFFEIIDRYEREVREEIECIVAHPSAGEASGSSPAAPAGTPDRLSAERLSIALKHYLRRVAGEPVFRSLLSGDGTRQLWRGGSHAARRRNIESDFDFVRQLLPADTTDHRIAAGMLRSLFFLIPHREEIGEEVFDDVMDNLADAVSAQIFAHSSPEDLPDEEAE